MDYESEKNADTTGYYDFISNYVDDLENVLDIDAIRDAGAHIGADQLGGASVAPTGRRSPNGFTWT